MKLVELAADRLELRARLARAVGVDPASAGPDEDATQELLCAIVEANAKLHALQTSGSRLERAHAASALAECDAILADHKLMLARRAVRDLELAAIREQAAIASADILRADSHLEVN